MRNTPNINGLYVYMHIFEILYLVLYSNYTQSKAHLTRDNMTMIIKLCAFCAKGDTVLVSQTD